MNTTLHIHIVVFDTGRDEQLVFIKRRETWLSQPAHRLNYALVLNAQYL